MGSVRTNQGALLGAMLPGLTVVSKRKAEAGVAAAKSFSRVGKTEQMSEGWEAISMGEACFRVQSGPFYTLFHEIGFHAGETWVAPQPMARPSMAIARAG